MPTLERVLAFACGSFAVSRGLMVGGEGRVASLLPIRMPMLGFAIGMSDGTWWLVDAGLDPERSAGLGPWVGKALGFLTQLHLPPAHGHSRRLADLGISREKVRGVLMTHLDYDHTGGLAALDGRPVHATREDWRRACMPALRERLSGRFATYGEYAHRVDRVEVEHGPLDGTPLGRGTVLEGTDGAITLVDLAGHTPGHQGVLVRPPTGDPILLCGDACYVTAHVTRRAPLGPLAMGFAADRGAVLRTLDRLREWHAANPAAFVIPSHDPDVGARAAGEPAVLY